MTQSRGVTVTAVTQLRSSETATTWKRERQNSPVLSCEVPIAAKARIAITVAPSRGVADWLTTSDAAWRGSALCSSLTSIPSTITIALSTSIPSAMISAPREMRSSATPIGLRKMKLPAIVSTRTKPIRAALRRPMKKRSTTITIATACSRLVTNPLMAVLTASDCNETIPISTPSGICELISRTRASSAWPMVTTLPPETVEMPRPTASFPSKRIR